MSLESEQFWLNQRPMRCSLENHHSLFGSKNEWCLPTFLFTTLQVFRQGFEHINQYINVSVVWWYIKKAGVPRESFTTLQKITPSCHCLGISIFDPYNFAIPHMQADYFGLIQICIDGIMLTMLSITIFWSRVVFSNKKGKQGNEELGKWNLVLRSYS